MDLMLLDVGEGVEGGGGADEGEVVAVRGEEVNHWG